MILLFFLIMCDNDDMENVWLKIHSHSVSPQYIYKTVFKKRLHFLTKVREGQRHTAQFTADGLLCFYGHKQVSHVAVHQEGTVMFRHVLDRVSWEGY